MMDHTMDSYPPGNPPMQLARPRPKTITKQIVYWLWINLLIKWLHIFFPVASMMDHTMASYPPGNPPMQMARPRPKTITKQKVVKPFSIIGGNGGPQGSAGGPSSVTMTTPSPTAAGKKPTIHIKQESGRPKEVTHFPSSDDPNFEIRKKFELHSLKTLHPGKMGKIVALVQASWDLVTCLQNSNANRILNCDLYRFGDLWRQCPVMCARIIAISIVLCPVVCVQPCTSYFVQSLYAFETAQHFIK